MDSMNESKMVIALDIIAQELRQIRQLMEKQVARTVSTDPKSSPSPPPSKK